MHGTCQIRTLCRVILGMATEQTWFQRALSAYLRLSADEQHRLRRVVEHGPVGRLQLDDGLIEAGFVDPYPRPWSESIDLPPAELPSPQVIAAELGSWWERFDRTPGWHDAVEEAISSRHRPSSS